MATSTNEIPSKGMRCLVQQLGVVEAEEFICVILREQFDYTKWHRNMFDDMTLHELNTAAAEYVKKHPYTGKGIVI